MTIISFIDFIQLLIYVHNSIIHIHRHYFILTQLMTDSFQPYSYLFLKSFLTLEVGLHLLLIKYTIPFFQVHFQLAQLFVDFLLYILIILLVMDIILDTLGYPFADLLFDIIELFFQVSRWVLVLVFVFVELVLNLRLYFLNRLSLCHYNIFIIYYVNLLIYRTILHHII